MRRLYLSATSVICILLVSILAPSRATTAPGQNQAPPTTTLQIPGKGVEVRYPAGWSAVGMANVHVLFNVPAHRLNTLDATALANTPHIAIFTERRKDHAEAVRRLKEIEAEATSPSTFLKVGGWPALQRRHLRPKPLPGQDATSSGGSGEMVLQITTTIAAGDLLVRLESFLPEDAPSQIADEVEAIGRSLIFATSGNPAQVDQEIQDLRGSPRLRFPALPTGSHTSGSSGAAEASTAESAGASVRVTNQAGRDSEIEIAVSPNGGNIVIGTNQNYHFSTNGGQTWNQSAGINGNDPSLGWGQSGGANGTFYAANIASPSTAISVSTDNGQNFAFQANAYTCGQGGDPACGAAFPDQEHIAVDRLNVAAGGDQVYSVWRHLTAAGWGIVCSRDSGNTWSTNGFFTAGDFPRITVGQDSFVYVVYLNGDNIMLSKFNSCENSQNPMVRVSDQPAAMGITHVGCPTPGLDRCNFRNTLASPTVAVDDTNPNHVYVAYAVNTSPGGGGFPNITNQNTANENIIVQDSLTGGTTWSTNPTDHRIVTVSTGVIARRFMPWVCAVGGTAHLTWFDRRGASPGGTVVSNNSLTDFFRASAFLNVVGNLTAGTEFQVNNPGTADAQCEAGFATGSVNSWPSPVDNRNDSLSCSRQPQLGGLCCIAGEIDGSGRCLNPTAASGQELCDFVNACPASPGGLPQQCAAQRGSPKYGDYNGSACGTGRFYTAWASATAPASILPPSADIDTFFSSTVVCCVPQIQIPGSVAVGDTCVGSTSTATLNVCNTGSTNLEIGPAISSSDTQFAVTTPSSGYPVVISPNFCFPFQLRFTPTSPGLKTATLTVVSNDPLNPSQIVAVTGNSPPPMIKVTGSGAFGDVCGGTIAEKTIQVCDFPTVGACSLNVTSVALSAGCTDFTLVNNPFPASVSANSCLGVTVRFTPTMAGSKSCSLIITSNDPTMGMVSIPLTANTPTNIINIPPDLGFPPTVIQSVGACKTPEPFPISNIGQCNLNINSVALGGTNGTDYSFSGMPSLPTPLQPGHILGEGNMSTVFAPLGLDRNRDGTLTVTYESDPITHATAAVTRNVCGEGVKTGARLLVTAGGVPLATVKKTQLVRLTTGQTVDVQQDLPLQSVTPTTAACSPFMFHREWGTVSNPIQLVTGSYRLTVMAEIDGKMRSQEVSFNVNTCDFNPNIVVNF